MLEQSLLIIVALIAASAFFSLAEISLAASRRLRLRQMADEGDARAERVLRMQEQPGHYFTVVQIGLNAVAILGGVVGEGALSPYFAALFGLWLSAEQAQTAGFAASFVVITSLFLLFADLFPKRLGMTDPSAWRCAWSGRCRCYHDASSRWSGSSRAAPTLLFKLLGMPLRATTDHLGRHPGHDRGRRARRRAGRARAAGDRQRVRARHPHWSAAS